MFLFNTTWLADDTFPTLTIGERGCGGGEGRCWDPVGRGQRADLRDVGQGGDWAGQVRPLGRCRRHQSRLLLYKLKV